MIASLSIPWGDEQSDDATGGYHLVWTRDLVKSVMALLAVGDLSTPLRALIYLAVAQRDDGGFFGHFGGWFGSSGYNQPPPPPPGRPPARGVSYYPRW